MDKDVARTATAQAAGTPRSPSGLRALVVEDETNLAGVLGSCLERDGFEALAERPRMAFSRRQLIDRVWGQTWVGDEHLVDVRIGHLADAARDRYQSKSVRLDVDLHPAGRVIGDEDRIGHVLGNLIDNALRHTPVGGTVTVSCRRVDDWVEYAVADTGDGIAAEHLPHLFDRFFRIDTARDRHQGGSGIGLAIAKALIEAHGGGISATSAGPGHGSTFTVRLPAA